MRTRTDSWIDGQTHRWTDKQHQRLAGRLPGVLPSWLPRRLPDWRRGRLPGRLLGRLPNQATRSATRLATRSAAWSRRVSYNTKWLSNHKYVLNWPKTRPARNTSKIARSALSGDLTAVASVTNHSFFINCPSVELLGLKRRFQNRKVAASPQIWPELTKITPSQNHP